MVTIKIAIIPNALDQYKDKSRRKTSLQREIDDLGNIGLIPSELDLRNYFGKPDQLKSKLSEYGALWVLGGNTFILRRAYKESGMDDWLQKQIVNKGFVYAGYCAGACVLSPTLIGLEAVDFPNQVPKGYKAEVIWDGLGTINFAFAPHYKSDHLESAAVDKEVEYYKNKGVAYKTLHDGEVIIMDIVSM